MEGPPGMAHGAAYEIQKQIRNNVTDLQGFMAEMGDWEAQMKKKDEAIRRSKAKGADAMPRPRGFVEGFHVEPEDDGKSKKKTVKVKKGKKAAKGWEKLPSDKPNAAGHTYDYFKDKWDKFDIDAALDAADESSEEEVEVEEEPAKPKPAPAKPGPGIRSRVPVKVKLTDVPEEKKGKEGKEGEKEAKTPAEEADELKAKGNEYFKRGKFELAKQLYSKCLEANPTAVGYANRAMACLKLGHNLDAESDCTEAIALDASYLKAWQRRGAARRAVGKYLGAVEDFEEALRLEPSSKALAEERKSCCDLYEAAEGLDNSLLAPRIVPVELTPDAAALSAAAPSGAARDAKGGKPQQGGGGAGGATGATALISAAGAGVGEGAGPASPVGGGGGAKARKEASKKVGGATKEAVDRAMGAAAGAAVILSEREMAVPKTGTEFETAWKGMKGDPAAQERLLGVVKGDSLGGIFKDQITAPMLVALGRGALESFVLKETPAKVRHGLELLEGLTGVGRFGMGVMLVPRKDKEVLAALFEQAGGALSGPLLERLGAVRKQFKM